MCDCRLFSRLRREPKETATQTARDIRDVIILTLAISMMEICFNKYIRNPSSHSNDPDQFFGPNDLVKNYNYQKSFCSSDQLFYALIEAPFKEEIQFRFLYLKMYTWVLTNFAKLFMKAGSRLIKKTFPVDDAVHAETEDTMIKIGTKLAEVCAITGQAFLFAGDHTKASQISVFIGSLALGYLALYNNAGVFASIVSHSTHNAIALASNCGLRA